MDRLLKINGRTYKAAEFDVNFICDMEDNGIQLEDIEKKMFKLVRMYVALSMGVDPITAGKEISEHMKNGGSLEDISAVMSEMMDDSDFFRTKSTDEETGSQPRTRKKKSESEEVIS
jgi:hypothetical protein